MNYRHLALLLHVVLVGGIIIPAVASAQGFVPLTNLPGLSDFKQTPDLSAFLNNLYKICIGIAAALAVFQIMRAGITFMTNKGSISENEKAKDLIKFSVFGLLLVLSPTIVFGIINPKILELDLDVSKLQQVELNEPVEDPGTDPDTDSGTGTLPDGSLVKGKFFKNIGDAADWYDTQCKRDEIPAAVADIVAKYDRDDVKNVNCTPGAAALNACTPDNKTNIALCEAHSKDVRYFREKNAANITGLTVWDSTWTPIPGTSRQVSDKFERECAAQGGEPRVLALDWVPRNCSEDDEKAIGDDSKDWMCNVGHLVCEG